MKSIGASNHIIDRMFFFEVTEDRDELSFLQIDLWMLFTSNTKKARVTQNNIEKKRKTCWHIWNRNGYKNNSKLNVLSEK